MVKKQNVNNLRGKSADDDINEEEDLGEDSPEEEKKDTKQSSRAKKAKRKDSDESSSNQAGKTDASLEQDEEQLPVSKGPPKNTLAVPTAIKDNARHYSADLNEGRKAKRQPTRFNKALQVDDEDDEDDEESSNEDKKGAGKGEAPDSESENEEFKEEAADANQSKSDEEDGSDKESGDEEAEDQQSEEEGSEQQVKSGTKQNSHTKSGQSKRDPDEKQPLLAGNFAVGEKSAQFGFAEAPNIQDLKRGFEDHHSEGSSGGRVNQLKVGNKPQAMPQRSNSMRKNGNIDRQESNRGKPPVK